MYEILTRTPEEPLSPDIAFISMEELWATALPCLKQGHVETLEIITDSGDVVTIKRID